MRARMSLDGSTPDGDAGAFVWSLAPGDVHVWWARLDTSERRYDELCRVLALDEEERAGQFMRASDRRRFVVARATLRCILARYLNCPPAEIMFRYESHGKPRLVHRDFESDLEFNLAHSHELAVYAFVSGRRIGVDIERVRPVPDLPNVARTAFSRSEQASLFALPDGQQLDAFFAGWTRKEAYLKGRGDGLVLPLAGFDVSLAPDGPAALLASRITPEDVSRWSIHEFRPVEGYVGAVAVDTPSSHLLITRWDPAEPT